MREARELRLSQQLSRLRSSLGGGAGTFSGAGGGALGGDRMLATSIPPPSRREGVESVRLTLTAPEARLIMRRRRCALPGVEGARWRLGYNLQALGTGAVGLLVLAAQCHVLGKLRMHRRRGAQALAVLPLLPVPDDMRFPLCSAVEYFTPPMVLLTLSLPLRPLLSDLAARMVPGMAKRAASDYVEERAGYVQKHVALRRAEMERAAEEAAAALGAQLPRAEEVFARLEQMRGSMSADAEEFHRSVVAAAERARESMQAAADDLAARADAFFSAGRGDGGGGSDDDRFSDAEVLSGPPTPDSPGRAPSAPRHRREASFTPTRGLAELLDGYNSEEEGLALGDTHAHVGTSDGEEGARAEREYFEARAHAHAQEQEHAHEEQERGPETFEDAPLFLSPLKRTEGSAQTSRHGVGGDANGGIARHGEGEGGSEGEDTDGFDTGRTDLETPDVLTPLSMSPPSVSRRDRAFSVGL